MVRIVISALWICLVTVASSYGVMMMTGGQAPTAAEADEFFGGLDYVKTQIISVPIVSSGAIQGYLIAQFVFTADGKLLRQLSVPPEVFLTDEAFQTIFAGEAPDFKNLKKYDLAGLKTKIAANVNKRFDADIVRDVLIEQFNFVPKDQVRYGARK